MQVQWLLMRKCVFLHGVEAHSISSQIGVHTGIHQLLRKSKQNNVPNWYLGKEVMSDFFSFSLLFISFKIKNITYEL